MREVEAKLVLGDCIMLAAIEERVKRMGGIYEGEYIEEDVYFQHPCRDFAKTDEALRVRVVKERVELTYKGPKEGGVYKARREITVQVDSASNVRALLEALGFKPVAVIRKKRRYYRLGRVKVTLDEVEGLGCFAEIEAIEGGEEAVGEAIRLLGLEEVPTTTKSYLELLLEREGLSRR